MKNKPISFSYCQPYSGLHGIMALEMSMFSCTSLVTECAYLLSSCSSYYHCSHLPNDLLFIGWDVRPSWLSVGTAPFVGHCCLHSGRADSNCWPGGSSRIS